MTDNVSDTETNTGQTNEKHKMAAWRTTSQLTLDKNVLKEESLQSCFMFAPFYTFITLSAGPQILSLNIKYRVCFTQFRICELVESVAIRKKFSRHVTSRPNLIIQTVESDIVSKFEDHTPLQVLENKNGSHTQQLVAFDDKPNLE